MSCHSFVRAAAGGSSLFERVVYDESEQVLGHEDVAVKVLYCGICHTDMYLKSAGQIPGHEIVGEIVKVGSLVKGLKKGDVVGFGYLRWSCGICSECDQGHEIMCAERKVFRHGRGGFSTYLTWDSRFVYPIPKNMEPMDAASLMCAGATVFSCLYNGSISPTAKVGVVGIGGLGHLALQFAKAWGCHVVAFTTSESKEAEAKSFGAHQVVNTKGSPVDPLGLDLIINTVSASIDYNYYVNHLKPNGSLCLVGVSDKSELTVATSPFLVKEVCIKGSLVASRHVSRQMLEFAARHNIKPQLDSSCGDTMTVEALDKAFDMLDKNQVRYRIVLKLE